MNETQKGKLYLACKKHEPRLLRAHAADGERTEIAVRRTSRGGRWTQAIEVLAELQWVKVELLDANGKLLAIVQHDAPAEEVESIDGVPSIVPRELQLLKLLLTAQDMVLQRHTEALRPMLDATRTVIRDLTEQSVIARREAVRQGEAASELAEQLARIAEAHARHNGDEQSSLSEILRLLPMLGRVLPPGPPTGRASAAPPRVKPNGHQSGDRSPGQEDRQASAEKGSS